MHFPGDAFSIWDQVPALEDTSVEFTLVFTHKLNYLRNVIRSGPVLI